MGKAAAFVAVIATMWAGAWAQDQVPSEDAPSLLERQAVPFVQLRNDLDHADKATLNAAKVTRNIHEILSSHDHKAISSGQMAYAALIAADTPAFADAIERRANKPKKREKFLAELRSNPAVVRELEGANEAMAAIRHVMSQDAARVGQAGERYIADAYRLQEAGWARKKLASNGTQRVNKAKTLASNRKKPDVGTPPGMVSKAGNRRPNLAGAPNWSQNWSQTPSGRPIDLDTKRQIYLTKTLVLATRYALDDLDESHLKDFGTDKGNERCYNYAAMNLAQCVSASRTAVEEVFCIGTHGLNDISRCVGWIAGAGTPKG